MLFIFYEVSYLQYYFSFILNASVLFSYKLSILMVFPVCTVHKFSLNPPINKIKSIVLSQFAAQNEKPFQHRLITCWVFSSLLSLIVLQIRQSSEQKKMSGKNIFDVIGFSWIHLIEVHINQTFFPSLPDVLWHTFSYFRILRGIKIFVFLDRFLIGYGGKVLLKHSFPRNRIEFNHGMNPFKSFFDDNSEFRFKMI